ncbi:MAG: 8-amino-7-oxononanoate synthase, partial [Tannerella sp.]|nr:8-amino-7-oxononanoate synthase [Tannerella sp.]
MQPYRDELARLEAEGNLRRLPEIVHREGDVVCPRGDGGRMLNLSSNDYLGLASDLPLRKAFLERLTPADFLPS